jgi:hypothetical protein
MKRCPTCQQSYTDETLQFCRVDGALLIDDESLTDESSATRILPASQTSGQAVRTASPPGTTSVLNAGARSKSQTGLKQERSASKVNYVVSGIKQHRIAALSLLVVIAAFIVGISFYLRGRGSEVTIGSIAVLPFVNQNNDPNTEYLSDGIPESIINSLSQLPNLKVMSRNSVFHYKGKDMDAQAVAKELKVQAVLTGRVAQRGDSSTTASSPMCSRFRKRSRKRSPTSCALS